MKALCVVSSSGSARPCIRYRLCAAGGGTARNTHHKPRHGVLIELFHADSLQCLKMAQGMDGTLRRDEDHTTQAVDDAPNMLLYKKMENIVNQMQDEYMGVSVRTVKSFLSKVPSVFTGADIVHWLMKNLNIDEPAEALRLGSQLAAHGYFFPVSDHLLTLRDDNTFYRFQTPYFWPSNLWEPENLDYAVFLCKRTLNNKARVDLADYEAESLTRLQRTYELKWEFIVMQAESQARIDRKHDKMERKVTESQERAFWDVHRPLPGCVNTTDVDMKKSYRIKHPNRMRKSVYGIELESRNNSPPHTSPPNGKVPSMDEIQRQIIFLQKQLDRHCMKISKVAECLMNHSEQYADYDSFLTPPEPSNPWLSEDSAFWDLAGRKWKRSLKCRSPSGLMLWRKAWNEPSQPRVRRWGFSLDELLRDPMGRECFLRFLESEFSCENLQFWLAVQDLKSRPATEVPSLVESIWREFLAPSASNAINLDSHTFEHTAQNIKEGGRHSFDDAQEHIYMLMKTDSYARFLRSTAYQELFVTRKKSEHDQDRRTSFEKFTRNVHQRIIC
uniref:regulator of G-protein signaling 7-like isoform X2 n=1 Tax=Myxine glutinosa TaxID=7769 RepID=UPI00358F8460